MRLLIISKFFPPMRMARAIQIGKVTTALRNAGAEIKVIAGQERPSNYKSDNRTSISDATNTTFVPFTPFNGKGMPSRLLAKAQRELPFFLVFRSWVKEAIEKAESLIAQSKIDLVMTSSTPLESHMVGLYLKRKYSIPWVASFSDPLPQKILPGPYRRSIPVLSGIESFIVRTIIKEASAIHMPSVYGIELTESFFKIPISQKALAIPHIGMMVAGTSRDASGGWVTHAGGLSKERVSPALIDALTLVAARINGCFKGLLFYGTVDQRFKKLIIKSRCDQCVAYRDPVPSELLEKIFDQSAALLVVEADLPYSPFLPSKFADYASSGRPIIAITPPKSSIRDYLSKFGGGYSVGHDKTEIADAICSIFDEQKAFMIAQETGLSNNFKSEVIGMQYLNWFHAIMQADQKMNPY